MGYPVTLVPGHFFWEVGEFEKKKFKNFWKKLKKLCFLSVFSLFLSFSVHTGWAVFSLINFTKVNCEG
jgi:hypothetical protein